MVSQASPCVGIDVAKSELVVCFSDEPTPITVANDADGIAIICERVLAMPGSPRVVFEATGGYEYELWMALHDAGIDARQVSAYRVRRFAEGSGQAFKTDAADARILASYAAHFPGQGRVFVGKRLKSLSDLVMRRQAYVRARAAARTRAHRTREPALRRMDRDDDRVLTRRIQRLDTLIAQQVASDSYMAARMALLRSIPGIGPVLAAILLARSPDLGDLRRGQAGASIGVAPMAQDSGTMRGQRKTSGGKREVRHPLYQAAMSAMNHNPAIRPFAQRLIENGKPWKKVVTAAARKLIELANAVLKRNFPFQATAP